MNHQNPLLSALISIDLEQEAALDAQPALPEDWEVVIPTVENYIL